MKFFTTIATTLIVISSVQCEYNIRRTKYRLQADITGRVLCPKSDFLDGLNDLVANSNNCDKWMNSGNEDKWCGLRHCYSKCAKEIRDYIKSKDYPGYANIYNMKTGEEEVSWTTGSSGPSAGCNYIYYNY